MTLQFSYTLQQMRQQQRKHPEAFVYFQRDQYLPLAHVVDTKGVQTAQHAVRHPRSSLVIPRMLETTYAAMMLLCSSDDPALQRLEMHDTPPEPDEYIEPSNLTPIEPVPAPAPDVLGTCRKIAWHVARLGGHPNATVITHTAAALARQGLALHDQRDTNPERDRTPRAAADVCLLLDQLAVTAAVACVGEYETVSVDDVRGLIMQLLVHPDSTLGQIASGEGISVTALRPE